MKHLKITFILFLLLGCQKNNEQQIVIGTWHKCLKDGSYVEYKITENYMLMLTTKSNKVFLFKNKISNNSLIVSEFKDGAQLFRNYDTLVIISKSKNKIILRSNYYPFEKNELNKAEFKIEEIDSSSLHFWKTKTFREFSKRAQIKNCPDIRNAKEKALDTIKFNQEEIEEIPIIKMIEN